MSKPFECKNNGAAWAYTTSDITHTCKRCGCAIFPGKYLGYNHTRKFNKNDITYTCIDCVSTGFYSKPALETIKHYKRKERLEQIKAKETEV